MYALQNHKHCNSTKTVVFAVAMLYVKAMVCNVAINSWK